MFFSAICSHHCRRITVFVIHALRPIGMAGEVHAINTNELGLPFIHSDPGRRLHRNSLDIRTIPTTPTGEVHRIIEDFDYAKAEAAEAIQTRAWGDAHTTLNNNYHSVYKENWKCTYEMRNQIGKVTFGIVL